MQLYVPCAHAVSLKRYKMSSTGLKFKMYNSSVKPILTVNFVSQHRSKEFFAVAAFSACIAEGAGLSIFGLISPWQARLGSDSLIGCIY